MCIELTAKNIIGYLSIPNQIIKRAPKAWDLFLRAVPSFDAWKNNGALPFAKLGNDSQSIRRLSNQRAVVSLVARENDGQIVLFNAFKPSQLKLLGLNQPTIHTLTKSLVQEKEAHVVFKHAIITHYNVRLATSRLFVTKADLINTVYHADEIKREDFPLSNQAKERVATAFPGLTPFDLDKSYCNLADTTQRAWLFSCLDELRKDPANDWLPSNQDIKVMADGLPAYNSTLVFNYPGSDGQPSPQQVLAAIQTLIKDRKVFVTELGNQQENGANPFDNHR